MPAEAEQNAPKQQIQAIISGCQAFLLHAQAEIDKATADNQVMGWLEVNFQHNAATLAACGIQATLQGPRDHFKTELPALTTGLRHLDNDVGNLVADIKLQPQLQPATLPRARRLAAEKQAWEARLDAALADCKLLRESHATLRGNLTPQILLPFAKEKSGNKGPIFDIGYKLYRLTSDHKEKGDEEKNLDDFFSEATRQETLFAQITMPELPKLAATVIKEQIKSAIRVTATVKDTIDIMRENFAGEQKHVKATKARITKLGKEDIAELLKRINEEADALYKGMLRFHYKAHHLDKIYDIEEILLLMQFMQRAIKNDLQQQLKQEIADDGSLLNLNTAAAAAADQFLKGPAGFWRGIKLLFRLLAGKETVNLVSFEATIRDALNSCNSFYGNTPEDILPLEKFINDKLSAYDAPFPREDLYKIMKKCLHDYGTNIEEFCRTFKVDISSITAKGGTITIKKLISQIEGMATKMTQ